MRQQNAQENLELAFTVAEHQLGVPKLLDPEDLSGADLDDKSVMTYLSHLYHVFPNPPSVEQLARDRERKQAYEEYVELAGGLSAWLLQSISSKMFTSPLPTSFMDLKRLQSDMQRFRISEVPARQAIRSRLIDHRQTLDQFEPLDQGLFPITNDIDIKTINSQWETLQQLLQTRDKAVSQGLHGHDSFQHLQERLKKVEEAIVEDNKKVQEYEKMHSSAAAAAANGQDAQKMMELSKQVETTAFSVQNSGEMLAKSISELNIMREKTPANEQAQVEQLHNKACQLNSTVLNLTTRLSNVHSQIRGGKPSSGFPGAKLRPVPSASEKGIPVAMTFSSSSPNDMLDWIRKKKAHLEKQQYGSDFDLLKRQLSDQKKLHEEIVSFRSKIEQLSSPNDVMKQYEPLVELSNQYLKDLQQIVDLLNAFTNQLRWLTEQHDAEAGRDWTNCIVNLSIFERRYESLMQELETRQPLWYDLVKQALQLADHPAHLLIETYTAALESESSAFLQLIVAFETHLEDARRAKLFQNECMEAERFLLTTNEQVSSSSKVQNTETIAKVKKEVDEFIAKRLPVLKEQAMQIKPLVASDSVQQPPKSAEAICTYRSTAPAIGNTKLNGNAGIKEGPQLVMNENYKIAQLSVDGKRTSWKVAALATAGLEFSVPAVCFSLAAPSKSCLERISGLEARSLSVAKSTGTQLRASRKRAIADMLKALKNGNLSPEEVRKLHKAAEAEIAAMEQESNGERKHEIEQFRKELLQSSSSLTTEGLQHSLESLREKTAKAERALENGNRSEGVKMLNAIEKEVEAFGNDIKESGLVPVQRRPLEIGLSDIKNRLKALRSKGDKPSPEQMLQASNKLKETLLKADPNLPQDTTSFRSIVKDLENQSQNASKTNAEMNEAPQAVADEWSGVYNELEKRKGIVLKAHDAAKEFTAASGEQSRLGDSLKLRLNNLPGEQKLSVSQLTDLEQAIVGHCKQVEKLNEVAKDMEGYNEQYADSVNQFRSKTLGKPVLPKESPKSTPEMEKAQRLNSDALALLNSFDKRVRNSKMSVADQKAMLEKIQRMKQSLNESKIRPKSSFSNEEEKKIAGAIASMVHDALEIATPGENQRLLDCPALRNAKTGKTLTLREAIDQGLIDLKNGKVRNPATGKEESLESAIAKGLIDPQLAERLRTASGFVDDTGVELTLLDSIQSGYVDVEREAIAVGDELLSIEDAAHMHPDMVPTKLLGLLTGNQQSPQQSSPQSNNYNVVSETEVIFGDNDEMKQPQFSVAELVRQGLLGNDGSIVDPNTGETLTLSEAMASGIVDGNLKQIVVTGQDGEPQRISLIEAIQRGLLDPRTGELTIDGQKMSLYDGHQSGDVVEPISLMDAISNDYLTTSGHIIDPLTRREMTIGEAVECGLLDGNEKCLRDPRNNQPISLLEAVAEGLVDPEHFTLAVAPENDPDAEPVTTSLLEAIQCGAIVCQKEQIEFTSRDIIDPQSGRLLTLSEALQQGVIDIENGNYVNPETGEVIPLSEAEASGLVPVGLDALLTAATEFIDPSSGQRLVLGDLISNQLFDPNTGMITNPSNGEKMSVADAQSQGLLSPELADALAKLFGSSVVKRSLLDTSSHHSPAASTAGSHLGPDSGVASNSPAGTSPPMRNEPQVRPTRSIGDALLLCAAVNPETGEQLSISDAEKSGMIDLKRGIFKNPSDGREMSIDSAIAEGLIITSGDSASQSDLEIVSVYDPKRKQYIPVDEAVKRGLYNKETRDFIDPNTGRAVPVDQALADGMLVAEPASGEDVAILSVKDPRTGQFISLEKAADEGILDLHDKMFKDPTTGEEMTINDAIDRGLIKTGKPVVYAIKGEPIQYGDLVVSSVTDPNTGEEISPAVAIAKGILDRELTTFHNPTTGETIDINQAIEHGMVRARKLSEHEPGRPDSNIEIESVTDPRTGERISKEEAVKRGLLQPDYSAFYNPLTKKTVPVAEAIAHGLLTTRRLSNTSSHSREDNIRPGHVNDRRSSYMSEGSNGETLCELEAAVDTKTGETLDLTSAIARGILDEDCTTFTDLKTGEKMPVATAIERGLLKAIPVQDSASNGGDVQFMLESVKDPSTGEFITVEEAIDRKIVTANLEAYRLPDGREISLTDALNGDYVKGELIVGEENAPLTKEQQLGAGDHEVRIVLSNFSYETLTAHDYLAILLTNFSSIQKTNRLHLLWVMLPELMIATLLPLPVVIVMKFVFPIPITRATKFVAIS